MEHLLPQSLPKEPTMMTPCFWTSSLLNYERTNFCCFEHRVCDNLPRVTNTLTHRLMSLLLLIFSSAHFFFLCLSLLLREALCLIFQQVFSKRIFLCLHNELTTPVPLSPELGPNPRRATGLPSYGALQEL